MGCCESRNNIPEKGINPINQNPNINQKKPKPKPLIREYIEEKPKMTILPKFDRPNETKNMDENLNYYRKLNVLRMLNNCVDSEVYLCENDIIRKKYPNNSEGMGNFKNEIGTYKIIGHLPFIPKLLCIDEERLSFYLPYYPFSPEKNERNKQVVAEHLKEMEKYQIYRLKKSVYWKNLVSDGSRIFLIDFGDIPIHFRTQGKLKWKYKAAVSED